MAGLVLAEALQRVVAAAQDSPSAFRAALADLLQGKWMAHAEQRPVAMRLLARLAAVLGAAAMHQVAALVSLSEAETVEAVEVEATGPALARPNVPWPLTVAEHQRPFAALLYDLLTRRQLACGQALSVLDVSDVEARDEWYQALRACEMRPRQLTVGGQSPWDAAVLDFMVCRHQGALFRSSHLFHLAHTTTHGDARPQCAGTPARLQYKQALAHALARAGVDNACVTDFIRNTRTVAGGRVNVLRVQFREPSPNCFVVAQPATAQTVDVARCMSPSLGLPVALAEALAVLDLSEHVPLCLESTDGQHATVFLLDREPVLIAGSSVLAP